jgi:hypothetical protein
LETHVMSHDDIDPAPYSASGAVTGSITSGLYNE